MGIRNYTKQEMNDRLDRMQHLLAIGVRPKDIMQELNLSERLYHYYRKRLEERTHKMYLQKTEESYWEDLEECRERIQADYHNAVAKSREPDAKADWGALAVELGMLLFRLKKEGLMAITKYKYQRLEQKARSLNMGERPLILQRDDSAGSGNNSEPERTTESTSSDE